MEDGQGCAACENSAMATPRPTSQTGESCLAHLVPFCGYPLSRVRRFSRLASSAVPALLFVRILFLQQDFGSSRNSGVNGRKRTSLVVGYSRQRLECVRFHRRFGFGAPAAVGRGWACRGEGKAVLQARAVQTLARLLTGHPKPSVLVLPAFREEPRFLVAALPRCVLCVP